MVATNSIRWNRCVGARALHLETGYSITGGRQARESLRVRTRSQVSSCVSYRGARRAAGSARGEQKQHERQESKWQSRSDSSGGRSIGSNSNRFRSSDSDCNSNNSGCQVVVVVVVVVQRWSQFSPVELRLPCLSWFRATLIASWFLLSE